MSCGPKANYFTSLKWATQYASPRAVVEMMCVECLAWCLVQPGLKESRCCTRTVVVVAYVQKEPRIGRGGTATEMSHFIIHVFMTIQPCARQHDMCR